MTVTSQVLRANLSAADKKRLRQKAASAGVPVPQLVGDAIRAYLRKGR